MFSVVLSRTTLSFSLVSLSSSSELIFSRTSPVRLLVEKVNDLVRLIVHTSNESGFKTPDLWLAVAMSSEAFNHTFCSKSSDLF